MSDAKSIDDFSRSLNEDIKKALLLPEPVKAEVRRYLDDGRFWDVANALGAYANATDVQNQRARVKEIIAEIRDFQGNRALSRREPTTVVFGTSGWRGVIGEDFTLLNVHKVLRAIVELLKSATFLEYNGYNNFAEVQKAGLLLLRDNRFMGDTFLNAARNELTKAGVKVYHAGECPTGVGSALLTELKAAGSINFTPSHNPMEYAGMKFNPADGGPADKNLTALIEECANGYMQDSDFTPISDYDPNLITTVDSASSFRNFLEEKSRVFDLAKIRDWLRQNKNDLYMIMDYMHGAARGYVEEVLGQDLIFELVEAGALDRFHTDDDFSFHGVKPEPSAKNQAPLIGMLAKSGRKLTLAVALDPDADRIRFADARMDIDMNRFAAIAYEQLLQNDVRGAIVSSLPSSDFPLRIARQNKQKVIETAVGFKNFREAFKSGEAVLGFEESDGISFTGHTLEKCALAGFLAALQAMTDTGKNLSELYGNLQNKYGYFYPDKAGADVKGVSVEAWQAYKNDVVRTLQDGLFKPGDTVKVGGEDKKVSKTDTLDGLKLIFDDDSWILLRPSGTEPKFRYYYEVTSQNPLSDPDKKLSAYKDAAAAILQQARDIVDGR